MLQLALTLALYGCQPTELKTACSVDTIQRQPENAPQLHLDRTSLEKDDDDSNDD